jgi:AcrR family transcriptional regulator
MEKPVLASTRSRVRAEITTELLKIARQHVAASGASSLSLRAVARDAGMVSSAIYRYFPSRDELLNALIIQGYEQLADAVEVGESAVRRNDLLGRHRAVANSLRAWARANPHDYALLYGTPVPGYVAPIDTVAQVLRVSAILTSIIVDALRLNRIAPATISKPMRSAIRMASVTVPEVPAEHLANGLLAWSSLFGLVSFEIFGHFHNVVDDFDVFFAFEVDRIANAVVGIS